MLIAVPVCLRAGATVFLSRVCIVMITIIFRFADLQNVGLYMLPAHKIDGVYCWSSNKKPLDAWMWEKGASSYASTVHLNWRTSFAEPGWYSKLFNNGVICEWPK